MTDIEEYEEEDYESDLKKELLTKRELKPCPFCGSTDVHLIEDDPGKSEVSITCKDCNVWVDHMFEAMSRDEAIELWNRRVNE